MLKYMLDTNAVIYTIKNRPPQVRDLFRQHDAQMRISTVTLGESVFAAKKSAQPAKNLPVTEGLLARMAFAC